MGVKMWMKVLCLTVVFLVVNVASQARINGTPAISERVAVITGAGSGIGREVFLNFAQQGYGGVVCIDLKAESCRTTLEAAQEIIKAANTTNQFPAEVKLAAYGADVSNFDSVQIAGNKILREFGRVDVLVNNAGITRDHLLIQMTEEEWHSVIKTNLDSVFYVTRTFVQGMVRRKFGRIVNVASIVGVRGNAGQANYAASKAGVIGFTKALAKEVTRYNVMANAVAPGFIQSAMTNKLPDAVKDQILKSNGMRRIGLAKEVASLISFLASDKASYISGGVYPIDGMQSM